LGTDSAEYARGIAARLKLNPIDIAITALSLMLGTITFLFNARSVFRSETVPVHIPLVMRCLLSLLKE
tara:strand:- start:399 stop:602 length:204 start_codon:yes stop_codon:yes gene_type:complete